MDALGERVWTTLVSRRGEDEVAVDVPGLGEFQLRTYQAYEGRNPRTGERVHVPAKTLPFFVVGEELRDHLNADTAVPAVGPEIRAVFDELRAGRAVLLGRLGALVAVAKGERIGRDPQRGTKIVIPPRVVVTFKASRQLRRTLDGEAPPRELTSRAVDEAFASIDEVSPVKTLAALDAAFERLAMEHTMHALVPPDEREQTPEGLVVGRSEDEGDRWFIKGEQVRELRDDGEHFYPIAQWVQDILTVAVVNEVARRSGETEVLSVVDARRVLARLSRRSPLSIGDLPF